MDAAVECTHCRVTMTSWSAPGSRIRYYQCPFCARTHSSLYDEVFTRGAGARLLAAPARGPAPAERPQASADDIRWAGVKQRAARWFARLEAEEHHAQARVARAAPVAQPPARAAPATVAVAAARPAARK
jgi:hypothetical protein